ncbi:hypothetical protein [Lacticaseibacillus suibinensis]|uniref:hypothetical protein n=1 Tax=Lacticaseibacillus suibinensis TaxID=2486011 RepID=UPI000F79103D|nr:hypothetical protein [Lacticaseibacillus suibinensis]
MKIRYFGFALVILLVSGLGACGVHEATPTKTTPSTATTEMRTKQPADYLAGVRSRGLSIKGQADVDVTNQPQAVQAESGVSFSTASNVSFTLLQFKSQALANQARSYYARQGNRVYSNRGLLLTASRGMAKGWFEKYQRAIFRQ